MADVDNTTIRKTVRISYATHPDLYLWLMNRHDAGSGWSHTLLEALLLAMESDLGDSQLNRIERKLDQALAAKMEIVYREERIVEHAVDLKDDPFGGGFSGFS